MALETALMISAFASGRMSRRSSREESAAAGDRKREHKTVLLQEAVALLAPRAGEVVVDATYGVGGHSKALKAAAKIKLIALDADPASAKHKGVIEANFGDLGAVLERLGVERIDKALFDLGWNMTQLKSGRGFSFLHDEPLDMSYGPAPRSGFTAAEALNEWSEQALADVFFGYGEERYARRIARAVAERRALQPLKSTFELVELIKDSVPAAYRKGRIHPATRTFQALRIAVNDELRALEQGLSAAWHALAPGGRIAVITFHSVEDRAVKRYFAALVASGAGKLLVKKPLTPSAEELAENPSSRSAKLRGITKH